MRFLVLLDTYDTLVGRETVGAQLQQVMRSGKVREAGFLTDRRGAFLLVDSDAAEELDALFGPEVDGHCRVQAAPVASIEAGAALFQQWAHQGR